MNDNENDDDKEQPQNEPAAAAALEENDDDESVVNSDSSSSSALDDDDDDESTRSAPQLQRAEDDDQKNSKKRKSATNNNDKKKKKPKRSVLIDDAAEQSGEDSEKDDDDDSDDDGEDASNDDYIRDDFVVDEDEDGEESKKKKHKKDDLEDSDSDDNDGDSNDDDDSEDSDGRRRKPKTKRVRRMREVEVQQLDDDDLALIQEAAIGGGDRPDPTSPLQLQQQENRNRLQQQREEEEERERRKAQAIVAHNEAELRKGLFYESDDDDVSRGEGAKSSTSIPQQQRTPTTTVERYDEDGMDDFIDDDIGDQDDIMASEIGRFREGDDARGVVSEAQLTEASEIFGTDYLDFMEQAKRQGGKENGEEPDDDEDELLGDKYRERGVGVDYGLDSDEEVLSDDDLFGNDDDDDDGIEGGEGSTGQQRAEALRLKREQRELAKAERRRQAKLRTAEKRKAQLRRAFEPVQLVEHFCTDRDDEIRARDAPERFFDWTTPFTGPDQHPLPAEITEAEEDEALWLMGRIKAINDEYLTPPDHFGPTEDLTEAVQKGQKAVMDSIVYALRFMHREKLEPEFIKRYRADIVTSRAVRDNLYEIMDEDGEWARLIYARNKVESLLDDLTTAAQGAEAKCAEEASISKLKEDLQVAQERLDETLKQERDIKAELEQVSGSNGEDDDEDDLFGKDEEDEVDEKKKKQNERLNAHLNTTRSLLEERAERVAQLGSSLEIAELQSAQSQEDKGPAMHITRKTCRTALWNTQDFQDYLLMLTNSRHIFDLHGYLSLLKEGNDAIRMKELSSSVVGSTGSSHSHKRSRRFNRDFYRTCVAEGLRPICYRFMLSPYRAGIKLEEMQTTGSFDYNKIVASEEGGTEGGPINWVSPVIPQSSPEQFASELIGSGDLVMLSSTHTDADDIEAQDPLRGCRYVAAMELAYEPRIRRCLRDIFRERAVLTTVPTKKGLDAIDAFHEYFGLHLIRDKALKEYFPLGEQESERQKAGLGIEECFDLDIEMKKRVEISGLQYLNILKAEQTGDVVALVHMPYLHSQGESWYKQDVATLKDREKQDLSPLMTALERVYVPVSADTDEWKEERGKILRLALTNFLLPQLEAEARRELREAATQIGLKTAAENLRGMTMEGPYRPAALLGENRHLVPTGDLPFVGVCCSVDGRDTTYLASVTRHGELNDHLAIPSGHRVDNDKICQKVINFLTHSRPAAILVGSGGGLGSRLLARKLGDILPLAINKWNNRFSQGEDEDDQEFEQRQMELKSTYHDDFDDEEEWQCNVDLVDDSLAQLFGRSVRGKKEFPDTDVNLKVAIATARYAKDPLAEYAYAWNVASDAGKFGTEMLYLNIHPMQQLLPKTMLLRQYERALCESVAEVGVDINMACTHDHLHGLLSFVPGLGPRKAAALKQNLVRIGDVVPSRRSLLEKRLMGPIVYNNSVAFLRIRDIEQLSNQFVHPLDDTRLHPDVYHRNNWAGKIAIDALERLEDEGKSGSKEEIEIRSINDVMEDSAKQVKKLFQATKYEWESKYGPTFNVAAWNPRNVPVTAWEDKVEELDLETFAVTLAEQGHGNWLSHLQMIKWEFRLPFEDPRQPMEPVTGDRLFRLLTGETDHTIRPGKEVTGKVVANGEFGSRIKLEGDIPAFIPLRNLADEHVEAAEDIVSVGSVVTAVVTEVKKDHLSVDMSLRMEDFRKLQSSWERPASLPPLDSHFDQISAIQIEQEKSKEREARLASMQLSFGSAKLGDDENGGQAMRRTGRVTRRACAHPAFRNAKHDEVDVELREGGESMVGEALIRPSSKSSDSLAIHWVVKNGSIKVIEVNEEDKDTDASIGNVLKIKGEAYGSIDELLGRFIAPMNDHAEALVHHRKFLDMSEDEADDKLRELKTATPAGMFYFLCWHELHAGYISLRYIMSSSPRFHTIGISPKGFLWRNKTFPDLDRLLNDFKKNPRATLSTSSNRSTTSVTDAVTSVPSKVESIPTPAVPSKPSRWGAKPVAPPAPVVPAWAPQPPPVPVAAQTGWGIVNPVGASVAAPQTSWQQPPPPQRPLPPTNMPPPPPGNLPPPPSFAAPPRYPPPLQGAPPPPAFGAQPPPSQSQLPKDSGRRGVSNLPAWMTQAKS